MAKNSKHWQELAGNCDLSEINKQYSINRNSYNSLINMSDANIKYAVTYIPTFIECNSNLMLRNILAFILPISSSKGQYHSTFYINIVI